MGKSITKGFTKNTSSGLYEYDVYNSSGTVVPVFDENGKLYQNGTGITATADELNKLASSGSTNKIAQFAEASIAFNDSAKALVTIPNGAKIYSITIVVTTGFGGTTPTYDVGYAADPDALIDGVALSSTAGLVGTTAPSATASQWANGVTSGILIGTFAGGGSNTAGAGKLRIAYYI